MVAIYHVFTTRVSGGVDVFLMLSGFFVGGSLWRRFVRGRPPKARTYLARHARRLLPTAVTVLAGTAIAFLMIAPMTRWAGGARETIASLFYAENWYLAITGQEYGAADSTQSPWQHFWSMSVQGQFFLLVPLTLLAAWWLVRNRAESLRRMTLTGVVIAMTLASFGYAAWTSLHHQSIAYFDTGARLWEFTAGMLLAIALDRRVLASRWWALLSWFGIGSLLFTGVFIDGASAFPGPWTLVPIVGAALLVLAGAAPAAGSASRILGLRWIAHCGRYAYAFYLWHWPILVLVAIWRGRPSGWKVGIAILVLSAILAVLTYHLVERPLREAQESDEPKARRKQWARPILIFTTYSLGVAVAASSIGYVAFTEQRKANLSTAVEVDLSMYPGAMSVVNPELYGDYGHVPVIPPAELASEDVSRVLRDGCVTNNQSDTIVDCTYVDGDGLRVALFGGSHSEHWFEVALKLAKEHDWTLVPLLRASCPPTMPSEANGPSCERWLMSSYERLRDGNFDLVITTGTRPTNSGSGDYVPGSYHRMMETLAASSKVLAIRDNASFLESPAECYAMGAECEVPLHTRLSKEDPTKGVDIKGVEFVDANDLICPEELCRPTVGNVLVFRDRSHLTRTYVETMSAEVGRRWEAAIHRLGLMGG